MSLTSVYDLGLLWNVRRGFCIKTSIIFLYVSMVPKSLFDLIRKDIWRRLIWLWLWFPEKGFWNAYKAFCTSNARNFLILRRIDLKSVPSPQVSVSILVCRVLIPMHVVSHDSARAWLNVSFTASRARFCYVLVCPLRYDSLRPGPGSVIVRIPLHCSPRPS